GQVPLDDTALAALWVASALRFGFIWLTHWKLSATSSPTLARWYWRSRDVLIAFFLFIGVKSLVTGSPMSASWLAWKVILFAGVLACGIRIRYYIRDAYRAWPCIWAGQGTVEVEQTVVTAMNRRTYVRWRLWTVLCVIGWLGVAKP